MLRLLLPSNELPVSSTAVPTSPTHSHTHASIRSHGLIPFIHVANAPIRIQIFRNPTKMYVVVLIIQRLQHKKDAPKNAFLCRIKCVERSRMYELNGIHTRGCFIARIKTNIPHEHEHIIVIHSISFIWERTPHECTHSLHSLTIITKTEWKRKLGVDAPLPKCAAQTSDWWCALPAIVAWVRSERAWSYFVTT